MKEFIDCGPRVVHEDDDGPFLKYKGEIVRSAELYHYVGFKVHVTQLLDGDGWEIHDWLDKVQRTRGGWNTRSGHLITYVEATQ